MADGILDPASLEFQIATIDAGLILYILYVIVVAYVAAWLITMAVRQIAERVGMYRTTVTMVIPLVKTTIYILALYYIITAVIEPSLSQAVAFFGLFGAGLGFGLKDLFSDVIGGLVVTFEKPYQIGDKVQIGPHYGEVIDIGIRSTRIVTPDDSLITVPNYMVFTQPVASANAGKLSMMVVIDLYIDSESDRARAMTILKEAVITSRYVYVARNYPFTVLLDDFPYYRRVRAKAYVNDLRYEFEFKSEVTRRAWEEMERVGIRSPRIGRLPPDQGPLPGTETTG